MKHFKKNYVICPICSSNDCTIYIKPNVDIVDPIKLYGATSGIKGTQTIVICKKCNMKYENPRFSENLILKAYSYNNEINHDTQYNLRVKSFKDMLESLINKNAIPNSKTKLLDVGTASGAFIEAACQLGFKASGIEPSFELVEKGLERNLDIKQGSIEKNNLKDNFFDIITLMDVIEHICYPKDGLIKIKKKLKTNGLLIINVPDHGSLIARLMGKKFWWYISVHLHFFTYATITKLLLETGFEVSHKQNYWQTLNFGYLISMAVKLNIPMSKFLYKICPDMLKKIPVKYYASQMTIVAKKL